jgi:Mg-chelatase subunit ChlD
MTHRLPSRTAVALLCGTWLLASCAATAQAVWPEPKPAVTWTAARVAVRPNFQAPSATHCARPVTTREVPGWSAGDPQARRPGSRPESTTRDARAEDRLRADPSSPPALARVVPAPAAENQAGAPASQHGPSGPQDLARPQVPQANVTAGVVDDNANFDAYLAFRDRTLVPHRPREVRERYLLEVKDRRGHGVGDAEVAVRAPNGSAMWARTDTGGRAWLHPGAFDRRDAGEYAVIARKDGREAASRLVRGQKSSVELHLDASPPPARARLDLVFVIDATGSMADEIDKLKASLRAITSEVARLPSRPDICLGLVAYRDRGDAFLVRSHDLSNDVGIFLQQALVPLQAMGGGDYPEAMNEGLHEAVHQLSWRGSGTTRLLVLLADAPPHLDYGAPHYDEDMVAALGKGIKVFSVGASGLDSQGEFIQRQIAQYTGGKFVFLTYADAHRPGSGPGRETVHDVRNYSVDTLDRLVVRLVTDELALAGRSGK